MNENYNIIYKRFMKKFNFNFFYKRNLNLNIFLFYINVIFIKVQTI